MKLFSGLILSMILTMGTARGDVPPVSTTRPSAASAATKPSASLSAPLPTATGTARLRFKVNIGNEPTDMCVVVCVSKKVGAITDRVPTMFYLGGLGDHGFDGRGVLRNGPPAEMIRRPYLNDSVPMM